MLKFSVILICILCYTQLIWTAPVIKASGIQWTEPKGNGKGNLTIMMIPQNNSCSNDSDMLVAVKSDYQVVSQDTQLLNLVVNEYQKDTCNKNSVSGLQSSNANRVNNQVSSYNTNSTGMEDDQSLAIDNQQSSQINLAKLKDEKQNLLHQKGNGGVDIVPYTTVEAEEGGNYGADSGAAIQNEQQNSRVRGPPIVRNENPFIEAMVSKDISKDGQIYQAADDLNMNAGTGTRIRNGKQNSKELGDFLKYISLISDPVQSNNAKYYEEEKKTLDEKIKTNPRNQGDKIGDENQNSANAEDVFKFLSALQVKGTTSAVSHSAITEPNQMATPRIRELSTMSDKVILESNGHTNLVSSNTLKNKIPRANIFNDHEMAIFKLLNVSEPSNKLKVKSGTSAISDDSSRSGKFDDKFLNELIRNTKLKQLHTGEGNLRPDSPMENQPEELVALDEGEFDTQLKLSRGAYFAPASATDEDILKYQLDLPNSYRGGELKLEENGNTFSKSEGLTTCASVTTQPTSGKPQNGGSSQSSGTDTQSSPGAAQNLGENKESDKIGKDPSMLSSPNSQNGGGTGASDLSGPDATNSMQTSTSSPSTASNSCRTSIVYICDSDSSIGQNSQNKDESQKKITLRPTIDCAAYLRTKKQSSAVTNNLNPLQNVRESENLQENANLRENEVFPFMVKLTNKNYISESNKNPSLHNVNNVLLNSGDKFDKIYTHIPEFKKNKEDNPKRQKIVRVKSKNEGQNVPIFNVKSLNNDHIVHPGQTLNLRFVGKKILLEQMPSFRSEKLDSNKNCDPKQTTEPVSDEMDPDENDKDGKSSTKSRKSKPSGSSKTSEQNNIDEITGSKGTPEPEDNASTISPLLRQTEIQGDKKNKSKPPGNSKTTEQNHIDESTGLKGTQEPEDKGSTISSLPGQTEVRGDKKNKSKPPGNSKTTEQNNMDESTGLKGTPESEDKGSTISSLPGQTEVRGDKKNKSKPPGGSQTIGKNNNGENTGFKITSGPEGTVSPIPGQPEGQSDKNSKNREKGSKHVTECKSVGNGSQNRGGLKHDSDLGMNGLKKKGSTSTQSYGDSLVDKYQRSTGNPSGNIKIQGDSVKEIVIQIIRHTNAPGVPNSDPRFAAVGLRQDELIEKEMSSKKSLNQLPPLKKIPGEKIKPGGYEMEISNMENEHQQKINYLHPMDDMETQEANIKNNNFYPSYNGKNIILENFYVGKANSQDFTPAISESDGMSKPKAGVNEKYDKALSYSDLKLLVDNNNIIYGG